MNSDPHGWNAFWRLYDSGCWEPRTKELISELTPGQLYVDVGAWIGPTVRWAVEQGAKVIAIEPDEVALAELRKFSSAQVEIWAGAVATTTGYAYLARNPKQGGAYGDSMSRLSNAEGVKVRTWSLADILQGRVPDMVKVDVEGYELELIPSLMEVLPLSTVIQISLHGRYPLDSSLAGRTVEMPLDPHGDLVIRPLLGEQL